MKQPWRYYENDTSFGSLDDSFGPTVGQFPNCKEILKMKFLLIIVLQLLSLLLLGQRCETIEGKTINCIDKDSLKQGFWYEYRIDKILTTDSFNSNPRAVGHHNDAGQVHTSIGEGFYKDGKRVGSWIFYEGSFNDLYPYAPHIKTVIYTDSGYRYEIDSFCHFTMKVSDDTSTLTGKINLKYDTVTLNCSKGKCILLNQFGKKGDSFKADKLTENIRFLNFLSYKVVRKKTVPKKRFGDKATRRIYSQLLPRQWALGLANE